MNGLASIMKRRGSGEPTVPTAGPAERARKPGGARAGAEEEDVILAPALSNVVGYLLRRSHNAFQSFWMASFRDSDTPITPVQGGMLVVLSTNPGLTQTALARMMNVEGPTLMQSIDRLESHGYLQRVRRLGDRRSYSLQLTPRGQEVLAVINAFLPLRDEELLADLTKAEVVQLAGLLTKVVERGHARLKELQSAAAAEAEADAATTKTRRSLKG
jgi:DNA-binding MarR family transcriptional regulator